MNKLYYDVKRNITCIAVVEISLSTREGCNWDHNIKKGRLQLRSDYQEGNVVIAISLSRREGCNWDHNIKKGRLQLRSHYQEGKVVIEISLSRREGCNWDPIDLINSATFLCQSLTNNLIFNEIIALSYLSRRFLEIKRSRGEVFYQLRACEERLYWRLNFGSKLTTVCA